MTTVQEASKSSLEHLPVEIIQQVYGFLDLNSIKPLALSSKHLLAAFQRAEGHIVYASIKHTLEPEILPLAIAYFAAAKAGWRQTTDVTRETNWEELCVNVDQFCATYIDHRGKQPSLPVQDFSYSAGRDMISFHHDVMTFAVSYFQMSDEFRPSDRECGRVQRTTYIIEIIRTLMPLQPPENSPDPLQVFWKYISPWDYRQTRYLHLCAIDTVGQICCLRSPTGYRSLLGQHERGLAARFGATFERLCFENSPAWLSSQIDSVWPRRHIPRLRFRDGLDHALGSWSYFADPNSPDTLNATALGDLLKRFPSPEDRFVVNLWLHDVLDIGTAEELFGKSLLYFMGDRIMFWDRERVELHAPDYCAMVTSDQLVEAVDGKVVDYSDMDPEYGE
ncbi:uncharacterized protein JN550_011576 [Neoarthrinium moseri]|uniref:uncharacterized protein n=1 Tax=Neoarthrinium moseri TaxID=1658444 RepID=UPI001FDD0744|nr:uncharacterized protein JN550_011576 [Neoarthrinium moseri]KAI1860310.1 hypothetical protein JN550_011576 [Neoarthrinium moseri]